MNSKNILFFMVFLLILFAGCNETKKLSEKELEEKAKEKFYGLDEVDIIGVSFEPSDFILKETEVIYPKEFDLYMFNCELALEEECLMTEDEFYSLNERVYVYGFELKEEKKREDRTMWGKVILKNNGEVIAAYINGLEHPI